MLLAAAALAGACGKKGPPLPPLVRLPEPPGGFTAERRGDVVDLQFTVPGANSDGTRPANVERVDVYGFTGPAGVTDDQLLKHGTRIGSVAVKAPPEPEAAVEPGAEEEVEPPQGPGLDQGAAASLTETITPETLAPVDLASDRKTSPPARATEGPLLGPASGVPTRTYLSVGISTRGRKGPPSKRVAVPLVPPPPPPSSLQVTYDEHDVTIAWTPTGSSASAATDTDVLPSTPIGMKPPTFGFKVYAVPEEPAEEAATLLTADPVDKSQYSDPHVAWGEHRCYTVRTVETIAGLAVESQAAPPACVTFTDTFPPAAPKGLTAVATERAISLIWQPNEEPDLAGYLVLRGTAGGALEPITPAPITGTTFHDEVATGVRFVYAVRAVDKTGNAGALSNRVEEVAR